MVGRMGLEALPIYVTNIYFQGRNGGCQIIFRQGKSPGRTPCRPGMAPPFARARQPGHAMAACGRICRMALPSIKAFLLKFK